MNKFTAGPWRYAPTGKVMQGYSQPFAVVGGSSFNLLCGCFGDVRGGNDEAEANARLIAAAPELLESLKTMHQHVLELCLSYGVPFPEASLSKSSSVISKATGE